MFHMARLSLSLLLVSTAAAQGKNLLFYGNSFTYYSWGYGVPELVGMIAVEAGRPAPTIVSALVGGPPLQFHATNPAQVAVISNALPPGQTWDHVVMQGHALEATNGLGFTASVFRSSAVAILNNVRNHSPAARAVMFQTWASAWGQMYYPQPWAVPMELHNEIRTNYRLAVGDMNTAFGAGTAVNAAVGDGVALLEWDPVWYEPDRFHPNPATILLAAMCIYTSIYGQPVCEVSPSFNPPGTVAQALAPFGLGELNWKFLAGIADSCADRPLRRYPGSGDHLLLQSGTEPGLVTGCHRKSITVGTPLQMQMDSVNGVFDGSQGWLIVSLFLTGSHPGPSLLYPEVQYDLGAFAILNTSVTMANPLSFNLSMPFSWPGASLLVQGIVAQQSGETGNPVFTTTEAHEFVFF